VSPSDHDARRKKEWRQLQTQLSEILVRHGRNALGGDYYLVPDDHETYDQKVLVFFRDALTPELLQAVSETLWRCSPSWRVSFVEAHSNGTELDPPGGFKVSANGPEPLHASKMSPDAKRETQALYDELGELLAQHGKSDPFGNGDFWIVEDKWGSLSHVVCIFNISFLTPQLAMEVQRLLQGKFPSGRVQFQIEVVEPNIEIPLPGIRILANEIVEDWSRRKMQSIFGNGFKWRSS
jgi:hypothetical protein